MKGLVDKRNYSLVEKQLLKLKSLILSNPINLFYVFLCIFNYINKRTISRINSFSKIKGIFLKLIYVLKLKLLYFNRPVFFVVGDSHVMQFAMQLPFVSFHLGPVTAYNISEKKSSTNSNKKLLDVVKLINKKKDYLIISAGEIDARMHVNRILVESKGKLTLEKVIKNNLNRYFEIISKLKSEGYSVLLLGIPPAATARNYHPIKHYASRNQRAIINMVFNKLLKEKCMANGVIYLDLYEKTAGPDGFFKSEYYLDGVHLNNKVVDLVKQMLKEHKLI